MNDHDVITDILKREGGYVDKSADRGGPTKYGITIRTLSAWMGKPATKSDVQALDEFTAREIYTKAYIHTPGFDKIGNDRLRALMIDSGVQHGPGTATKWLQTALGAKPDGQLGPKTMAALGVANEETVYLAVLALRAEYYGRILVNDASQHIFALGWLRRLGEFIKGAV